MLAGQTVFDVSEPERLGTLCAYRAGNCTVRFRDGRTVTVRRDRIRLYRVGSAPMPKSLQQQVDQLPEEWDRERILTAARSTGLSVKQVVEALAEQPSLSEAVSGQRSAACGGTR